AVDVLDVVVWVEDCAGRAGEHFGDEERLRQEALDLPGSGHRDLVLFGKLIHAENGDDVLERLVALQDLLHASRHRVMLFPDDERRQHPRGRIERIYGGGEAFLGGRARQHRWGCPTTKGYA